MPVVYSWINCMTPKLFASFHFDKLFGSMFIQTCYIWVLRLKSVILVPKHVLSLVGGANTLGIWLAEIRITVCISVLVS